MNTRRRLTGVVASNKMTKTVIVEVSSTYRHPLYQKVVHKTKRFQVHDEKNCQVGDEVQIVESSFGCLEVSEYAQEVPTAEEV